MEQMKSNFTGQPIPLGPCGNGPLDHNRTSGSATGFRLAEGEYFVECPYVATHVVRNVKLDSHLMKCRQNFLNDKKQRGIHVEYASCHFMRCNNTFPIQEVEFHIQHCPRVMDPYSQINKKAKFPASCEENRRGSSGQVQEVGLDSLDCEEDWEKIPYTLAYDPQVQLTKRNILIRPVLVPKSEKKAFYAHTKERYEEQKAAQHIVEEIGKSYKEDDNGPHYGKLPPPRDTEDEGEWNGKK